MNGFCPIGPSIVTPDEMADPHNLNLKCIVNGVTKQDSNTKQLVFKTEEIVSWCSKFCTLLPGDLILTGTPPGVGCFKNPPEFLKVSVFFILVKIMYRGSPGSTVFAHLGNRTIEKTVLFGD